MRYCSPVSGLAMTCVGAEQLAGAWAGTWIDDVARVVAEGWLRVVRIAAAYLTAACAFDSLSSWLGDRRRQTESAAARRRA